MNSANLFYRVWRGVGQNALILLGFNESSLFKITKENSLNPSNGNEPKFNGFPTLASFIE